MFIKLGLTRRYCLSAAGAYLFCLFEEFWLTRRYCWSAAGACMAKTGQWSGRRKTPAHQQYTWEIPWRLPRKKMKKTVSILILWSNKWVFYHILHASQPQSVNLLVSPSHSIFLSLLFNYFLQPFKFWVFDLNFFSHSKCQGGIDQNSFPQSLHEYPIFRACLVKRNSTL